jgi:transposase
MVKTHSRNAFTPSQITLFDASPPHKHTKTVGFRDPDPSDIYIGAVRLDLFLKERDLRLPIVIRNFLRTMDLDKFLGAYSLSGRAPFHPAIMLGLILYGLIQGKTSFREMERLAASDLGALWICGGLMPDHTAIFRFINRHSDLIEGDFFEQLTMKIVQANRIDVNDVNDVNDIAIDGTVTQAVGSRYKKLRLEKIDEKEDESEKTERQHESDDKVIPSSQDIQIDEVSPLPQEDPSTTHQLVKDEQHQKLSKEEKANRKQKEATKILIERAKARKSKGRTESVSIAVHDPDATVQPLKKGGYAPSYKPSIAVNKARIIVAHGLDSSSETAVFEHLLEQSIRTTGGTLGTVLADSAYNCKDVIETAKAKGVEVLIPGGKNSDAKKSDKQFPKSMFKYDEDTNSYTCPAGKVLLRKDDAKPTNDSAGYVRYQTKDCSQCPLRSKCTNSKEGRIIKRYDIDKEKEALEKIMQTPEAKEKYAHRKGWVEPVFGELLSHQRMQRFRRFGLPKVRVEFALHAMAHNMRRLFVFVKKMIVSGAHGVRCIFVSFSRLLHASLYALFCCLGRGGARAHVRLSTV